MPLRDGPGALPATGVWFDEPTPGSLREALQCFERNAHLLAPAAASRNAARFSRERFRSEFTAAIADLVGPGATHPLRTAEAS